MDAVTAAVKTRADKRALNPRLLVFMARGRGAGLLRMGLNLKHRSPLKAEASFVGL
jgi:hypothetical protein